MEEYEQRPPTLTSEEALLELEEEAEFMTGEDEEADFSVPSPPTTRNWKEVHYSQSIKRRMPASVDFAKMDFIVHRDLKF